MQVTLLGRDISIDCPDCDRRRLQDLADALDARLARFPTGEDDLRRLALTALALLDEAQSKGAALALARTEIERLTDMLVEAKLEAAGAAAPVIEERGRVGALRDEL